MFEKYDHKVIEPAILKYWQERKIIEKLRQRNSKGEKFYFLEGPPYTSGKVHIGTAWVTALKDPILRYKRMKGFKVWDRMGYDMHGLPTEQKVMAKFNLKNKQDIENFGLKKFTDECEKFCKEMMVAMNQDLQSLGITLDFSNPYQPIKQSFMEAEWWLIKRAHEKKRLYQGLRTMHWDSATQSSVAKHELEYKSITDTSIFVKFPDANDKGRFFIIWTTTPWTIPLNLAVMVNPEMEYVEVEVNDETWVVAKELVESVMRKADYQNFRIAREFLGEELQGQSYVHPLGIKEFLPTDLQKNKKLFTILLSKEYVDASAGTGLVHCAPGCGPEDYEVGHQNKIPPFNCVDEAGLFKDFGKFTDWKAKLDDKQFIQAIEDVGALLHKESYVHDYPHGERSHQPVIFRTTKQWFFKVEDLREKMLAANEEVYWNPESGKNAFRSWLQHLRDNSITKQRYWGTPVPIWQCGDDFIVVGSVKELEELSGMKVQSMHIPGIDKIIIKKDGKTYTRIPDVLDVWIDAGTASWNCLDYPNREDWFNEYFPADFILEGKDQIRGWFNLLMVASFIAFDKAPFKNVYMNGFVTDVSGVKMSKSLGNIITPDELINKHGADVMRYYMFQNDAGCDINFSWDECTTAQRQLHILWNTHKLLFTLALENKINPYQIKQPALAVEEKYILSRLNSTIKEVSNLLEHYRIDEIVKIIESLYLDLSRTYIQMIRDKSVLGSKEDKEAVIYTIGRVIFETIKMLHLISPFISEAIYLNLQGAFELPESSISHYAWPGIKEGEINEQLETDVSYLQEVLAGSFHAREKAKLGLRWPIKEVVVETANKDVINAVGNLQDILLKQCNAKAVRVVSQLEGVKLQVRPDYAKIGPAFGKLSKDIITKLGKANPDKILADLEKGEFVMSISGQEIRITRNMLMFDRTTPEGFFASETKHAMLYVNSVRSEDLEEEGYAREVMRHIQNLRKKAGLEKLDRIKLHLKSSIDLTAFLDDIQEKVGALDLTQDEYEQHDQFSVKDEKFEVWFEKV